MALVASGLAVPSSASADDELSGTLDRLTAAGLDDAPPAIQADAVGLRSAGTGSLMRIGERLVAEVQVSGSARSFARRVAARGTEVIAVNPELGVVTIAARVDALSRIADLPGVDYVGEVLQPKVARATAASGGAARGGRSCADRTVSEGDVQLRAAAARGRLGVDGSGIEVGVLSDSFDTAKGNTTPPSTDAADDVRTGDLPGPGNPCGLETPVDVLREYSLANDGELDEGRAMLQIVHDLAPGASLSYATAYGGEVAFANNIKLLADSGADVITDDIIYLSEPLYQDGIVAGAISDVTRQGVAYFTSAGNQHQEIDGQPVGSWEAASYRPTPCPSSVPDGGGDCMDFDPGPGEDPTQRVALEAGAQQFVFNWAEPADGVETDFDFFLQNSAGENVVTPRDLNDSLASGNPNDVLGLSVGTRGGANLVIRRDPGGETPRLSWTVLGQQAALPEHLGEGDLFGPTVLGHANSEAAESVGAVAYDDPTRPEPYSSRGDRLHLFGPVDGDTPAEPLPSPVVIPKPDIAATDGGLTTFFGGGNRFYGTSAAAPHAAAVAALGLSANPSLTPEEVLADLESTARPVGSYPEQAVGAGLIDAVEAVTAGIEPPVRPRITGKPRSRTSASRARFVFRSRNASSYRCKLDQKPAKPCSSPTIVRVAKPKRRAKPHTFSVVALNPLGERSAAAKARWTVRKR